MDLSFKYFVLKISLLHALFDRIHSMSAVRLQVSSILLLDSNTFEILHSHELEGSEMAMSLASCQLGNDNQPYYVVGTAVIMSDETESKMVSCTITSLSILNYPS